jgi:DNA polymerase-3 subunit gamma/tau
MAYQVLARKYRPQRFADVAGQDHVTRTLTNALTQNRIAHGYIFSGHRGIGKTTIARILAQALNCRNAIGTPARPSAEPCGECDSCREIRQGNAVDVIEIDAATNRGIDEIRELREAARYSPARDKFKVYILDEAHQITDAAFNALLKTLEEPPAHVIFMMATTEPESIPQTIRSRCQHFSFHAVRFDDILAQLRLIAEQEAVTAEDAALALLAEAGDGSMRDALSIMDQAIASAPVEDGRAVLQADQIRDLMGSVPNAVFERLMESVSAQAAADLMQQLDKLISSGNSPAALARQLVRYLRNCLMAKLGGENTQLLAIAHDERARAMRTAALFSEDDLTRNLQIILRTFDDLSYRQEQRFHLELGLLKLIQAQKLLPMEEILSGLAGGARKPESGPSSGRSSGPSSSPSATARSTPQPSRPLQSSAPAQPAQPAVPSLSPFAPSTQRYENSPDQTVHSAEKLDATKVTGSSPYIKPDEAKSTSSSPIIEAGETKGTGFSPHTKPEEMKGTGFSPYIKPTENSGALAPEGSLPQQPPLHPQVGNSVAAPPSENPAESANEEPEPAADPSPHIAPPPAPPGDLDPIRSAVAQALHAGGHATAATLLEDARWTLEGSSVRIEVNAKPTMIRITFNQAAEKLIRQGLAQAGAPGRFLIVPGEGLEAANGTRASRSRAPLGSVGSIEAEARNHPLVVRAQEIFHAEICSVVDLRDR